MTKGIDISSYQGNVDFVKVKNDGIDFVILREGYGSSTTDSKFFEYVKQAKEAGLSILGVYHFLYSLNPEGSKKEAQFCVENVKKAGLDSSVMIFSDFEYDTVKSAARRGVTLTKADCNAMTVAFCEEVGYRGFIPGVYTNIDYHKNWYYPEVLQKYNIWLADYSGEPDFSCLVQQYSSKGSVKGINGNVDMDYFYGTIATESPTETKDVKTLANEVISGKWGNGADRKKALITAGYDYSAVQKMVNQIVNGTAVIPTSQVQDQSQPVVKKVVAVFPAHKFNTTLAGSYVTTANLYCRNDAGTNMKALCKIPKGTRVQCYGYYNVFNGVNWLYIQFVLDGVQYTGFSSSRYLQR